MVLGTFLRARGVVYDDSFLPSASAMLVFFNIRVFSCYAINLPGIYT